MLPVVKAVKVRIVFAEPPNLRNGVVYRFSRKVGRVGVGGNHADRLAVGEQVAVAIADFSAAALLVNDLFAIGSGFPAEFGMPKYVQINQPTRQRRESQR